MFSVIVTAFLSPASANICNVGLMRHNELSEGVDVLDNNGKVVGSSKIAARHVSCFLSLDCIKHVALDILADL